MLTVQTWSYDIFWSVGLIWKPDIPSRPLESQDHFMICNEWINACNAIMILGYMDGQSNHLPWLNHGCKIECLHKDHFWTFFTFKIFSLFHFTFHFFFSFFVAFQFTSLFLFSFFVHSWFTFFFFSFFYFHHFISCIALTEWVWCESQSTHFETQQIILEYLLKKSKI